MASKKSEKKNAVYIYPCTSKAAPTTLSLVLLISQTHKVKHPRHTRFSSQQQKTLLSKERRSLSLLSISRLRKQNSTSFPFFPHDQE